MMSNADDIGNSTDTIIAKFPLSFDSRIFLFGDEHMGVLSCVGT